MIGESSVLVSGTMFDNAAVNPLLLGTMINSSAVTSVRQQWNFSPPDTVREVEEYQVELSRSPRSGVTKINRDARNPFG